MILKLTKTAVTGARAQMPRKNLMFKLIKKKLLRVRNKTEINMIFYIK